jgi:anti-sigma factor RsiW
MTACKTHRARLGAYLDGELADSRRQECEGHLAGCPACRAVLDELKELAPVLRTLGAPPVPDGLSARILATACDRQRSLLPAVVRAWIDEMRAISWLDGSLTAASLCAVIVIGGFMGWTSHAPGEAAEMAAYEARPEIFDTFGALPGASIEAATLDLLTDSLSARDL